MPVNRTLFTITVFALVLGVPHVAAVKVNSTSVVASQLTITGSGFDKVPLTVTFNGTSVAIVSSSASQIIATIPATSPGLYRVVVKSGTASATTYATVPTPSILFGECFFASAGGWIWLFGGGQPCNNGWHYPPGAGIPATSSGALRNLRAMGWANDGTAVTLWVNDQPTNLSCTISNKECNDLTDVIFVNAGDQLALGVNGGVSGFRAAVEFTGR